MAEARQVTDFLGSLRGFHSFRSEDVDNLLYQHRFELLQTPPKSGGTDAQEKRLLPLYSEIPRQDALHDMLLEGSVPGGWQCISHVLYPESVPWPASEEKQVEEDAATQTVEDAPAPDKIDARPTEEVEAQQPNAGQHLDPASPKAIDDGDLLAEESAGNASLSATGTGLRRGVTTHIGGEDRTVVRSYTSKSANPRRSSTETAAFADGRAEVYLCGQKVSASVRGRPVFDPLKLLPSEKGESDKFVAAKENRLKLERAKKLEEYQERKLVERIKQLEEMKALELEYQEELEKREARRKARGEEIKQQISKEYQRRAEEEAEAARKLREKKAATEEQAALEERPPKPPRAHDRPGPAPVVSTVGLLANGNGRSGALSARLSQQQQQQSQRSPPGAGWSQQTKAVASMYGLSPREQPNTGSSRASPVEGRTASPE